MKYLLAAFSVAACLAVVPCLGQGSQPLQAGITRTINLAPLDPKLAPGNVFDKDAAEALINTSKSSNNWHMVPAWYTGQRSTDQMAITYSRDEESGAEDRSTHLENRHSLMEVDTYTDKTGQMWEYDAQGFWIEGEGDDDLHYNFVLARTSNVSTDKECDHQTRGVGFHVDKKTNIIKNCDRSLAQISASPISRTAIRSKTFQKIFDWQGAPTRTVETVCNYKKTGEEPADGNGMTRDGKPLYPLFVQFLKDHNMADRIPDPPAAPKPEASP